uniref:Uncharacterized protein n=1 Tax=Rhizophora mucronata TaxID=61149 RepID=A0A2P2PTV7_RHIMU
MTDKQGTPSIALFPLFVFDSIFRCLSRNRCCL